MVIFKKVFVVKLSCILAITCTFCLMIYCAKNSFIFPKNEDFLLTASVSRTSINVGESIIVKGEFKNLADKSYRLDSSATFSNSGIININKYELDEKEMILVGSARLVNTKPKQEVIEEKEFKIDKSGKYKIVVSANFDIMNDKKSEKREYNLKADTIIIDVKDR